VVVTAETEEQRRKREHQRLLFDGVARLYDATRRGYPAEIVSTIVSAAAIGPGAAVLEIGCGTGQFTRQLAGRALDMTAIDIGAAMVAAARRNVADPGVRFQVCSFEDFAGSGPFDLIVSATAFHWIDPAIGLAKAARLLRPGGWLALLATGESYPEPLRTQLRDLWVKYSNQSAPSAGQPAWLAALQETSLFGPAVEATHARALQLPAQTVMGVERTRATFLSYSQQEQASFTADLGTLLQPATDIDLAQETFLAMAPSIVARDSAGA
jgi:ubiquinone/menaquinone biosynthesis C-methylase UbiE